MGGVTVEQIIRARDRVAQEIKEGCPFEHCEMEKLGLVAGRLAAARAPQEVIAEQTVLAERRAELAARRLEAEVRRPPDAAAYRRRTLAEAQRDQAKFTGRAVGEPAVPAGHRGIGSAGGEAYAERTTAEARADDNRSRAELRRDGNQEPRARAGIIEALRPGARQRPGDCRVQPDCLNGAEAVNEVLAGLVGQGLSILDTLKKSTTGLNGPVPTTASAHGLAGV